MFRNIVTRFRGMLALYLVLGVVCAALAAANVYILQRLIDHLTGFPATGPVVPLLTAFFVFGFLQYTLTYLDNYPSRHLTSGIYHHIKSMALQKVARIDYTAYQDIGTGTLVQLVENGASAGRDILYNFYLNILAHLAPDALFSLLFIGVYHKGLMLAALSGYIFVFIITRVLLTRLRSVKEEALFTEENLSKTYVRAFMEMVVFRTNRRFEKEYARVTQMGRDITQKNTRIVMVHELFFTAFAVLVLIVKVVMIALGVGMIARGELTVGALLALIMLADRIYTPVAIFNVLYVDYKLNRITWSRYMDFWNLPDDPNLVSGKALPAPATGIAFENVSFSYSGQPILKDVSFEMLPGTTTALAGPSGAGKSTIARMALGLLKPQGGRVLVNGQDLKDTDLNSLYQATAYISQDAPVFDGTLRENLCFDMDLEDSALWQALSRAQLQAWAQNLPKGLHTQVGEHGVKLSGGERQRLAFARVFLQKPSIVVLDEPTSALDFATEANLSKTAKEVLGGSTIISIAHRLSTIYDADQILVVSQGGISERGTHAQLIAQGGLYASLVKTKEESA